jgi:hypothetical protein
MFILKLSQKKSGKQTKPTNRISANIPGELKSRVQYP